MGGQGARQNPLQGGEQGFACPIAPRTGQVQKIQQVFEQECVVHRTPLLVATIGMELPG